MKNRYIVHMLIGLILLGANTLFAQTTTYPFAYTGSVQTWTVPAGVTSIIINAQGAKGGYNSNMISYVDSGGHGACVVCTLAVTPGNVLDVYVGGIGGNGTTTAGGSGGYNGGAAGATVSGSWGGGGGGGASDVRVSPYGLTNRMVVAGGGGGAGLNYATYNWDKGGDGGGLVGENGWGGGSTTLGYGGYGGTATAGGGGGTYPGYSTGATGALGIGGAAASGTAGGGGGGGYYGGGGGSWAGGGGGSSYTDPLLATGVTHTRGCNLNDNGHVDIIVLCSPPTAGAIIGSTTLCQGATSTLTDPTGTGGGRWTSTATGVATIGSSSGIVTGVSAGTATISYSVVLSCGSAYATTVVTVLPAPDTIAGITPICQGTSITVTDDSTGGTWSSSNPGVANVISSLGLVIGATGGTSIITYSLPTGCFTTASVSVIPVPLAIGGPTSICMSYPVTLTEGAWGGTWTSSNTAVATIGSLTGLVTPVAPGTTDITYSNGCGTDAVLTVTVNPLPSVITGTPNACVGYTTTFHDSTSGGTWTSFATGIATVDPVTGVITGVSGGVDRISYTLPTGCFVTNTVSITPSLSPITGPSSVCAGATIGLTSSVLGGVWTSSAPSLATVGSTGTVTGVSMGIASITYTIGTGCNSIKTVTVNPIAPIVGRDSICVGATGYFTDIVGGGTWTSSSTATATISIDSGLISGLTPGLSYITYRLPTGCAVRDSINVIALPPAIAGTPHLCPGTTTTLLNADTWGSWSSRNTNVATINSSGVVTGVNADTVTISYSINPGCKAQVQVTVNPLPAPIAGRAIDCPGITDTLTDASAGGTWSSITPALGTIDPATGVVSTIAGGTATFVYTLPTGCTASKSISIHPAPAPTVVYNWYDQTFYTDLGYVSYQWYDSIQGLIPGATSPNLAALYNEYYYVVVTDSNGCKAASALYHFDANLLGISKVNNAQVSVYPNPTTGTVYIKAAIKVRAVISGIDGKKEMEQVDAKEMDISNLADGVYFIALYDDNNQIINIQKLVKK